MLDEDRDFLLRVLALPHTAQFRELREQADRLLHRNIEPHISSPALRDLALRIAAIPVPQGEEIRSVTTAAGLLIEHVEMLGRQEPTLKPRPDPKFTRRNPES